MIIRIHPEIKYQSFEGFGASGAWWAQCVGGWDNIDGNSGLPVRDLISRLLWSRDYGIGLRTYRYNIGAGSKDSGRGDIANPLRRTESFESSGGKLDFGKDENAVYMMKRAVADGAGEIVLFVNSPPESMTGNGLAHCSKSRPFRDNLPKEKYLSFAKYCLDVAEHFVGEGLPVRYLSPINEPLWKWDGGQEGCHYSPSSAGKLMEVFAREISGRPSLDGVRLSGLENGDIRWFNKSYTRNLLRSDVVRERIDSVDVHSYFLNPFPPFGDRRAFLRRFRKWMDRRYPGVDVKMSEWTHMKGGRDRSMDSALVMAGVMFEDISILNVTSWQHWIAVSEVDYCDGLIYINLDDRSFELTKRYFATGNLSKYIPFGARRIGVECDDGELMILAFDGGSSTILIVINDTLREKSVTVPSEGRNVRLIVTDDSDNLKEYSVGEEIGLTPRSVNTIIF